MNVELLKLGWRIRASRKKLGWSQKDFSSRCGLDRSYFGGVERGERNLTFSSLCQICVGLNCDIAAVTDGIPYPERGSEVADIVFYLNWVASHCSKRQCSEICLEKRQALLPQWH